jgi:uncharacterized membrane protein YfcA
MPVRISGGRIGTVSGVSSGKLLTVFAGIFALDIIMAVLLIRMAITVPFSRLPENARIGVDEIHNGVYSVMLKDILPISTALIGFAAGLASGIFGVKITQ